MQQLLHCAAVQNPDAPYEEKNGASVRLGPFAHQRVMVVLVLPLALASDDHDAALAGIVFRVRHRNEADCRR